MLLSAKCNGKVRVEQAFKKIGSLRLFCKYFDLKADK
jgi:hypothetical protein